MKKRKNHISNKDYIEIAAEQFARLFWRQYRHKKRKERTKIRNLVN